MFSQMKRLFSSPVDVRGRLVVDEPPTPAPPRRLRPPRPKPGEKRATPTSDDKEDAAAKPVPQAIHVGSRPRFVHFDLSDDEEEEEEEEEVSGSYYPPGVAVPPSRLQIFANRPRGRKVVPQPPSPEVQAAMDQLRADIRAMENPPPTWIGHVVECLAETYRNKRDYRWNHGLVEKPGLLSRMKRKFSAVREALRRYLHMKKKTQARQLPAGIDTSLRDYFLHCEHPDPKYPPIIPLIPKLLETAL